MRIQISITLLFLVFQSFGQEEVSLFGEEGVTRAIVIGVSKYEDERIDPLTYAHKDAELFAAFLQSPAGGSVPLENMRLLTNEKATNGNFVKETQWLIETCKSGDKAFIYFSGHGDVERITNDQTGYLLTYNTPFNLYPGGAFSLAYLQTVINTLESKQVKVVLITDACHSGKLAGEGIKGSGATTAALAKSFSNTIKVLSCQPDEFSMEGPQWGGGHGAFTYHLIQGLMGLADTKPTDGIVTVVEINDYLTNTVTLETAPKDQYPQAYGDLKAELALVDKKTLKDLQRERGEKLPSFAAVDTKGFEKAMVSKASQEVKKAYDDFVRTLEARQLLAPEGDCTDFYYKQLMADRSAKQIWSTLTRNFAAALQDGSQEAYNAFLKADSMHLADMFRSDPKFSSYPSYLGRACELLGENHYMYNSLKARQLYFEGLTKRVQYNETGKTQESLLQEAEASQEQSLEYESENANTLYEIGVLKLKEGDVDKAIAMFTKAIELAPTWSLPVDQLGGIYMAREDFRKAREMYAKALELSPSNLQGYAHRNLGYANQRLGNFREAEEHYLEAKNYSPNDPYVHYYLGSLYREMTRLDDAEAAFRATLRIDPGFTSANYFLGLVYQDQNRYADAMPVLKAASEKEPKNASFLYHLGINYFYMQQYEQSTPILQQVLSLQPDFIYAYNYLGQSLKAQGQLEEAKTVWTKAMGMDQNDPEHLFQLGLLRYEQEDLAGAEALLKKALDLQSELPYALYYLGMTYWKLKRLDESLDQLLKAQPFLPNEPDLNYQIGLVYYEKKQFAEAEPFLKKAIDANPSYGLAYYTLGLIYKSQGRPDEAAEMLGKARELGVQF